MATAMACRTAFPANAATGTMRHVREIFAYQLFLVQLGTTVVLCA